jgi:succinoglycan biosynthesis protein ExoA
MGADANATVLGAPTTPASADVGEELVTVVVPARDEARHIGQCLDSILAQRVPLEVLVVDGRSRDLTRDIIRHYARRDRRVRLLSNPDGTISRSLNMALEEARGQWLVRIDAHSKVPDDYLSRLMDHLRTGKWGGVGGRKDAVGITPAGRAIAAAMGSRFGQGDSTYHYGTRPLVVEHIPFGAYPVALARQLGGWDERLPVNQDYEFDYRVRTSGALLLFDPNIKIKWYGRQSLRDLFMQYRRYGRDKAASIKLHPDSARPRHLAPPLLVSALVAAAALAPHRPRAASIVAAPYAMALAVASAVTVRRVEGWGVQLRVPGAFTAMHLGWGLGFWEGLAGRAAPASTAEVTKREAPLEVEPASLSS